MIEMPDINVLVALLDGLHVHHDVARAWFDTASQTGWATCPLTISGVIRVIARPQPIGALSVIEARDLLNALILANSSSHTFWPDNVNLADESLWDLTRLQGYRQVSDLHLLAIAQSNHGALVSLDGGITYIEGAIRHHPQNIFRLIAP